MDERFQAWRWLTYQYTHLNMSHIAMQPGRKVFGHGHDGVGLSVIQHEVVHGKRTFEALVRVRVRCV